jgi:hypothetical protein
MSKLHELKLIELVGLLDKKALIVQGLNDV